MAAPRKNAADKKNKAVRAMPKNTDAEQAVLAAVMIDNIAADAILPRLKATDFYDERHAIIFAAAKAMQADSTPVDMVTVADKLETMGKLSDAGGLAYLSEVVSSIPSAANSDYYFKIVERDGLLRELIRASNDISKDCYGSIDAKRSLSDAASTIFDIEEKRDTSEFRTIADAARAVIDEVENISTGNDPRRYVKSGYKRLDRMILGFQPGDFCLIAARPSVGKTAFALNIAANVGLNQGKTVAIFSLEMGAEQLVKRMLSHIANVSQDSMKYAENIAREEIRALFAASEKLQSAKVFINDYAMITPGQILSQCRRLKRKQGLDLVIIDYLQLMKMGDNAPESRQYEVAEISRLMKLYAKELQVPFLVLSQLSRKGENRGSKDQANEPRLSDLRDSGSIEQDADMVMFLHRPNDFDKAREINEIELYVSKNRNGPCGKLFLEWQGALTRFTEKDKDENGTVSASQQSTQPKRADEDDPLENAAGKASVAMATPFVPSDGDVDPNAASANDDEDDFDDSEGEVVANDFDLDKIKEVAADIFDDKASAESGKSDEKTNEKGAKSGKKAVKSDQNSDAGKKQKSADGKSNKDKNATDSDDDGVPPWDEGADNRSLNEAPFDGSNSAPNLVTNEAGNQETAGEIGSLQSQADNADDVFDE